MSFTVETGILNPDTSQYAGVVAGKLGLAAVAEQAARLERLGFDGVCVPEAGHDPFLPLALAASSTKKVRLSTNVAIAFPRSQWLRLRWPGTFRAIRRGALVWV